MAHIVTQGKDPAFWPESFNPFFTLPNGKVSCYADQAIQSLKVMSNNEGKFDAEKLIQHFLDYFGNPDGTYQDALLRRRNNKWPIEGPWVQSALISMMDRHKAGINPPGQEDGNEHDGLVTALPLIIQQSPNLDKDRLMSCFRILTQDPDALERHFAEAFLIQEYIKGSENPIPKALEHFQNSSLITNDIKAVLEGLEFGETASNLVRKFGWTCPMPGSFQSSLVSIIKANSYEEAIRETILCGGDCCSRSNLIGACLGAKFGIERIPIEWIEKVDGIEDIIKDCIAVFKN